MTLTRSPHDSYYNEPEDAAGFSVWCNFPLTPSSQPDDYQWITWGYNNVAGPRMSIPRVTPE